MNALPLPLGRPVQRKVVPPVGNDIVDLGDSETQLDQLHPRFLQRVFTKLEGHRILSSTDSRVSLWGHWAAKESVYKAARKRNPSLPFAHSSFVVEDWEDAATQSCTGRIAHEGWEYLVDVARTNDWLHAVALPLDSKREEPKLVHGVEVCPEELDPSTAVRLFACGRLAEELGCDPNQLTITRTWPPLLLREGKSTGVDISLSHHGRWLAFAAVLPC